MSKKKYIVYLYKNQINGKVFIGRTCQDIDKIIRNSITYSHYVDFYKDIIHFGWDIFDYEQLADNLTNYESKKKQNEYIEKYDSISNGYNTSLNNLDNKNSVGPGRPSKDRSNKLIIGFEGTIPLKSRLLEEAKEKHLTLSAWIRQILERHFEER